MIRRVVPPVLNGKETLLPEKERRSLPSGMPEAVIVRFRHKGVRAAKTRLGCKGHELHGVLHGTFGQFQLPARRLAHVKRPVGAGLDEGMQRNACAQPGKCGPHPPVQVLMRVLWRPGAMPQGRGSNMGSRGRVWRHRCQGCRWC